MPKNNDYKPGNPEYDFWNDKNLYPSLRHDYNDFSYQTNLATPDNNAKISGGSVLLAAALWLLIWAPFALFLRWQNWLTQVIFWGGLAIVLLIYIAWFHNLIQESRKSQNPPQAPIDDPDLPFYKKYPPADVLKNRKKE